MMATIGRRAVGACLALATMMVAACTSTSESASPSPSTTSSRIATASASPTPTVTSSWSPPEQRAVAAAEKAYRTFIALGDRAAQTGRFDAEAFRAVSGDPALPIFYLFIKRNQDNGVIQRGTTQIVDVTPTSVDLDADPATVRIQACLDASRRHLVFKANNQPAYVQSKNPRVQMPVKVVYAKPTGAKTARWLVVEAEAGKEPKPC